MKHAGFILILLGGLIFIAVMLKTKPGLADLEVSKQSVTTEMYHIDPGLNYIPGVTPMPMMVRGGLCHIVIDGKPRKIGCDQI